MLGTGTVFHCKVTHIDDSCVIIVGNTADPGIGRVGATAKRVFAGLGSHLRVCLESRFTSESFG